MDDILSTKKVYASVVFAKNRRSTKKIVINRGGTRSGKTYSILQIIFMWLMHGEIDERRKFFTTGICSVVRKYSATLNGTVIRDREEICIANKADFLLTSIHRNKTEKTYTYQGRTVEFIGADDSQKIRGRKRDILYCNEANELQFEDEFFQLMIRTEYKIFIDFNPDDEDCWINTELEQKRAEERGDVEVIVSTYKDNIHLPKSLVDEIEYLKDRNPAYWLIYGLGQYGKVEGLVFKNWEEIPEIPVNARFVGYGLDFGFTNDPSALTGLWMHPDGGIILDEVFYESGLTNSDIAKKFDSVGVDKTDDIVADSSEPKSIEEISRFGYNIEGVIKGPDSIIFGIDIMQQQKIYVTALSKNLKKELKTYSWKKDKNGKYTNVPIDANNHAIDGARYISMTKLKKSDLIIAIYDDRPR